MQGTSNYFGLEWSLTVNVCIENTKLYVCAHKTISAKVGRRLLLFNELTRLTQPINRTSTLTFQVDG